MNTKKVKMFNGKNDLIMTFKSIKSAKEWAMNFVKTYGNFYFVVGKKEFLIVSFYDVEDTILYRFKKVGK